MSNGSVFSEYVVHLLAGDFVGQVADVEDAVDLGRKAHVVAVLVHSHGGGGGGGGSRTLRRQTKQKTATRPTFVSTRISLFMLIR